MQTFLPVASFEETAKILDYRRLGKQRVEARQILNTILNGTTAWKNHPAVRMWRGFTPALLEYSNVMILEWIRRGYKNTMEVFETDGNFVYPPWFSDKSFHASHRSNLLRKDFDYYSHFGWVEDISLPYVWPA